jgi:hypothetical protein
MAVKYIKWQQNIPNGSKIYQTTIKFAKYCETAGLTFDK